jgi:hypothetical protein
MPIHNDSADEQRILAQAALGEAASRRPTAMKISNHAPRSMRSRVTSRPRNRKDNLRIAQNHTLIRAGACCYSTFIPHQLDAPVRGVAPVTFITGEVPHVPSGDHWLAGNRSAVAGPGLQSGIDDDAGFSVAVGLTER